jgi:uncharacterized protein (DUF433 family)
MSRLDRITSDPSICHGKPTVRGVRYPVENLLELLASGMTIEDVIADHPDLERDDLLAALEIGALATGMRRVVPQGPLVGGMPPPEVRRRPGTGATPRG